MRCILPSLLALGFTGFCIGQDKPAAPAAPAATTTKPAGKEEPKVPAGLKSAMEAANKGDWEEAVKQLKSEAEKGSGDAMNALGEFAFIGRGMKASAVEAQRWFQKGAEANNGRAQLNLARLLLSGGEGVTKDEEKADFLLRQAAEAGLADAQFVLGEKLERKLVGDGKGPSPDLTEPRKWYEKAAKERHSDALLAMARFADGGLGGVTKSLEKGAEYTYQAAQAGNVVAMNEMGVRYQKGLGMKMENVAAIGWFLSAAELGLPAALVNLGNCYEVGNGVPKNLDKAGANYAAAARQNYSPAQFLLARMFAEGLGTQKNLVFAYVNYLRAAKGGIKDAQERADALKKQLTPEQLKEADGLMTKVLPKEGAAAPKEAAPKGAAKDAGKDKDTPKSTDKNR